MQGWRRQPLPQRCRFDSDCPSGQFCYADLSLSCNFTTSILRAPTPVPAPTSQRVAGSDSRLVAFLGNWQRCPTDAMVAPYTDIVISFAVTYQGLGSDSTNCIIGSPVVICNGQNRQVMQSYYICLDFQMNIVLNIPHPILVYMSSHVVQRCLFLKPIFLSSLPLLPSVPGPRRSLAISRQKCDC